MRIYEIISTDVLEGDMSLQNYSVTGIQKHIGVKISCSHCFRIFTFSAKEQQFWYEKMGFWADSVAFQVNAVIVGGFQGQ